MAALPVLNGDMICAESGDTYRLHCVKPPDVLGDHRCCVVVGCVGAVLVSQFVDDLAAGDDAYGGALA
ncbi:hypothetical protein MLPF_0933 [Mycobacterium lepromatosis]|nr:hypothetical protein MLPF_0933 [Mycobacterium lepromatosis]